MSNVVQLTEDHDGNLVLPLSDDMMSQLDWDIDTNLEWVNNKDGTFTISKAEPETELVLVDTVQQYRVRYIVKVPKGKHDWALDAVTCEEVTEFSQSYLGETIVTAWNMTQDELIGVGKTDNDWSPALVAEYIDSLEVVGT
jgi:hypothetical protein